MKPESFLAAVRETMRRRGMDTPGRTLVACSGGPDSLALLHALHRIGLDLVVGHFDHAVRAGSTKDASFVRRQADRLGLDFLTDRAKPGAAPGMSPEEAMRSQRLAFLERAARDAGALRIATGHTLDDQAETVLMRFVVGTGLRGLGGIPPVRGPYIRPLIDRTREEIEAFCTSLRLQPRRDETNADPAYLRNALRAELLPLVRDRYNARISEVLARTADVARDEEALLDELASGALQADVSGGGFRLRADGLGSLHPALQRRVIRRLVPLDASATERVRRLALEGSTGDGIDLAGGLNARLEYGWLTLGRAPVMRPAPEPVALEVPGVTDLPGWSATMRAWTSPHRPAVLPDGVGACALDAAKAKPPLVLRAPQAGDRFRPLGMTGFKKLGDFFTDAKVPATERSSVPVLVSKDRIAWVVGHRIDDRFKVTRTTKRVLVLERGGANE